MTEDHNPETCPHCKEETEDEQALRRDAVAWKHRLNCEDAEFIQRWMRQNKNAWKVYIL